jgi:AAA domain/Primase C terminal 2 (PriCT-2)
LFGEQCFVSNDLGAGLETNIEEIKSAMSAIPPSALSSEPEWVKLARGLAHEARRHNGQAEELWQVLDSASAQAPGYDAVDNRQRWLRYIEESLDRANPITIATVFDVARKHGWKGWCPTVAPTSVANPTSGLGPAVQISSGLKVSFSEIRHRRWLYGVDLVNGEITVLAAPGGVGKSSVAIGMSVAVATGKRLLEEGIYGESLSALYVNAEDSRTEMSRRIWAFCLQHGLAEQGLGRLHLLGSDDWQTQRISFLRTNGSASVLDVEGVGFLESLVAELRPNLVVLDPLVALCGGGNLNDNAAMSLVMRSLKRLANKFDCAILLLHHTRKGGDLSSAEAVGGASAIVNLARRALMAVPMTAEEAPKLGLLPSERFGYFKVTASKSNLAPASDNVPWYKLDSVTLPNPEPPTYMSGDGVQAVVRVHLPRVSQASPSNDLAIRRAILDTVARGKSIDGQSVPYSPNTTGAKNQRSLLEDAISAAAAASAPRQWSPGDLEVVVKRAIDAMKTECWLSEKEIEAGRFRRGRGLKVSWSRTPWPDADSGVGSAVAGPTVPGGQSVNGVVND